MRATLTWKMNDKVVPYFLLGLGLLFMVCGVTITYFSVNGFNKLKENGIKTNGIISDIIRYRSGNHVQNDVFVTFITENKTEVTIKYNYYSSDFYKGKPVELYYDPVDPSKIAVEGMSFFLFLVIFGGIGFVFFIIGLVMAIKSHYSKN